jgi:hypothetical protein
MLRNMSDYYISIAKPEDINNKIKTMKRPAYGYREQKFFELKIPALHEKTTHSPDEPFFSPSPKDALALRLKTV